MFDTKKKNSRIIWFFLVFNFRIPLKQTHKKKSSYLHGTGVSCGVGAHLEESSLCGRGLTSLSGCAPPVHHHGLSSEQTHQVRWLFPLHHPHLVCKHQISDLHHCQVNMNRVSRVSRCRPQSDYSIFCCLKHVTLTDGSVAVPIVDTGGQHWAELYVYCKINKFNS